MAAAATALAMMLAINAPPWPRRSTSTWTTTGSTTRSPTTSTTASTCTSGYPYLSYYPHLGYEIDFDDHDLGDNDLDRSRLRRVRR
jgi:hypothetical protein